MVPLSAFTAHISASSFRNSSLFHRIICVPLSSSTIRKSSQAGTLENFRKAITATHAQPTAPPDTAAARLLARGILGTRSAQYFRNLTPKRANRMAEVVENRTRYLTVVLENVHGVHNCAAVCRSADAFGVQDIHFVRQEGGAGLLEKLGKQGSNMVSKGAEKWLTLKEHRDSRECVEHLRAEGYRIYVSSLAGEAVPLSEVDLGQKVALFFGNEGEGVSQELLSMADTCFVIPMRGFVQSYNVSVAVSVTLALTTTKCRERMAGSGYQLSEREKRGLLDSWLKPSVPVHSPKMCATKMDVTSLGHKREMAIIDRGFFVNWDGDPSSIFQLHVETGVHVLKYFRVRRAGAIGEQDYGRRCKVINEFISSTAGLGLEVVGTCGRREGKRWILELCNSVNDSFASVFDSQGVPTAVEGEASQRLFEQARKGVEQSSIEAILRHPKTMERCGSPEEVVSLLSKASPADVLDILLKVGKVSDLNLDFRAKVLQHAFEALDGEAVDVRRRLDDSMLTVMDMAVRIQHCAWLNQEVHLAIRDKHIGYGIGRTKTLRFAPFEIMISNLHANASLAGEKPEAALSSVVCEYWTILQQIRKQLSNISEVRGVSHSSIGLS